MYRSYPYPPFQYPFAGQLGEVPAGITQGSCEMARNAGANTASGLQDPEAGFLALMQNVPEGVTVAAIDGLRTCYMEGYTAKKTEMEGYFYSHPKGQTGLVVGGIAGLVLGVIIGKVLL